MGSFDTYCMVCGGQPDVKESDLEDGAEYVWGDGEYDWPEESCRLPVDPLDFMELIFDKEDVIFQTEGALVGPFENGVPMAPDFPTEDLLLIPTDKVAALHDMLVEDYGVIRNSDGAFRLWVADSRRYFFLHKTCLSLIGSFSHFTINTLWDVYRRVNTKPYATRCTLMQGINYFEIEQSIEQFVNPWFALDHNFQPLFRAIQNAPDPNLALQTLFLKNADMWVFVAPDRFPLHEAFAHQLSSFATRSSDQHGNLPPFSTLPPELLAHIVSLPHASDTLSLLATSNAVRAALLSVVDLIAKQDIHSNSHWMVAYGEEDRSEWAAQVMLLGSKQPFPWFAYRSACERHSYSMRNRHRIWKILKQMEAFAEEQGIL